MSIDKKYKLPCDVKINHMTFKKGVSLDILVQAATRWQTELMEKHAIDIKLTDGNFDKFIKSIHDETWNPGERIKKSAKRLQSEGY